MAKLCLLAAAFVAASNIFCVQAYPLRRNPYALQAEELTTCRSENAVLSKKLEAWKLLMRSIQAEVQSRNMGAKVTLDNYGNQKLADDGKMEGQELHQSLETRGKESQMGQRLQRVRVSGVEEERGAEEQKNSDSENQEENKDFMDESIVKEDFEDGLIIKLQELSDLLTRKN